MIDIGVNIVGDKKLDKLLEQAPGLALKYFQAALVKATLILERESAREAPVDTGYLRRNIRSDIEIGQSTIDVVEPGGQPLTYAEYVHNGTSPYTIRPKNGKVLAFEKGGEKGYVSSKKTGAKYYRSKSGKKIFARQVRHPGIKANPFFTRAVENNKLAIERQFRIAANLLVKHFK